MILKKISRQQKAEKITPYAELMIAFLYSGGGAKKRPAWDLKGRLQDMESKFQSTAQERQDLMSQMNMYNERIALLENKNTQLSGTVAQKEEHSSSVSRENDTLRRQLR